MDGMRRILLVDCDQFFVQCARLADPEGAGREPLLLVGGSADGRGVVTSASYATREFGVRSGMPTARALRLCPRAAVVPVPGAVCRDRSHAVREVLRRFTPVVEPASIDEAYLDMTGTERLYHHEPLDALARRIREVVLAEAGIEVSIGGGTSRLIAKMAVRSAKPAGVHVVEPGAESDFMRTQRISAIPGVGPVLTAELERFGLVHVTDALALRPGQLSALLGPGRGEWLEQRLRGEDDTAVVTARTARSISRDETFRRDLDDDAALARELRRLIRRLGSDLRAEGLRARTVTVRIRDSVDFRTRQAARTVEEAVETDRGIYRVAHPLLLRLRRERRTPARLIGVAASGLTHGGDAQIALLADADAVETERERALARVADQVRARFGPGAIRPGD